MAFLPPSYDPATFPVGCSPPPPQGSPNIITPDSGSGSQGATGAQGPVGAQGAEGGGGLPAWFQSGDGDPITANPTTPNTVGGLYFDTSGASGLWVATASASADWVPFGAISGAGGITFVNKSGGIEVTVESLGTRNVLLTAGGSSFVQASDLSTTTPGVFFPMQAPTVGAPAYVLGGMYFDTTLNKLCIGGAAGWETVTSV